MQAVSEIKSGLQLITAVLFNSLVVNSGNTPKYKLYEKLPKHCSQINIKYNLKSSNPFFWFPCWLLSCWPLTQWSNEHSTTYIPFLSFSIPQFTTFFSFIFVNSSRFVVSKHFQKFIKFDSPENGTISKIFLHLRAEIELKNLAGYSSAYWYHFDTYTFRICSLQPIFFTLNIDIMCKNWLWR